MRACDWRRGLDQASLLAPFCSRAVVLGRVPDDADALLAEAAYYGIGVVVAETGEVQVLADPEPFTQAEPQGGRLVVRRGGLRAG